MEEEKHHEEDVADIKPENSNIEGMKSLIERDPMSSDNLRRLFDQFFSDTRNEDVRISSMQLIIALWSSGKVSQREELMRIMEEKSQLLMQYGKSTKEFFQLFSNLCLQMSWDSNKEQNYQVQTKRLFRGLINIFSNGLKHLLSHPDHLLYQFLEDIVDDFNVFQPQFLEANGCLNCYGASEQIAQKEEKIAAISSEIRAGSFKLVMKLKKTLEIQTITMPRDSSYQKTKRNLVKTIAVYVNNSLSADMNSLRTDMTHWKKIKVSNFETETGRDYVINLPVSVSARYLCLEFTTVSKLPSQCTRCAEVRTENSGFYCIQCQYCSLIQIENTTVKYKPSFSPDSVAIESDKAKENCDTCIAEYTSKIQEVRKELLKEKQRMRILFDRYNGTKCNNSTGILLNSDELDRLYQDLMTNVNYLIAHRKALAQYNGIKQDSIKQFSTIQALGINQVNCYGCLHSFLENFLQYIHKRENMQMFCDLAGQDVVDELLQTLEDIYTSSNSKIVPEKIISKAMRVHKSILVMTLGEKYESQLTKLISGLHDDLLSVSFSDSNVNYSNFKTRIMNVKALQESLREQLKVSARCDFQTDEEAEKLEKLTEIANSILQLPNRLIPSFFCKSVEIPINFQNEVFVPLLEIIVSEIASIQPLSQRISNQQSELREFGGNGDKKQQTYRSYRSSQQQQSISSREPPQFVPNPFGALSQASSGSTNFPSSWRQQDHFPSKEQLINQMFSGGYQAPQGYPGVERNSWAGNFGQFLSFAQQVQSSQAQGVPSFPPQKKEKKQQSSSRSSILQPEFGLPPPAQFSPRPILSHPGMIQPQIPLFPPSSSQSATKKKDSKKRNSSTKQNDQEKLIDLFTLLIGQKDQQPDRNSSSRMEVESQNRDWVDPISSKQIRQDVLAQNFKLKPDNWLQKSLELLDSRRLMELIHTIVISFAQLYSRTACTLMLHALPNALIKQDLSSPYFDLFREVIQLFNTFSAKQDSQPNIRKLPGLSMVHQQSSEDAGFARKTREEDDNAEEFENLNLLTTMFRNLDQQLKGYERLQNKQLISTKDFAIQNLQSGQTMISLANLIKTLTENVTIKQVFKNNNKHFMHNILNSIVSLRKFKFILNQNFYQIEAILSALFQELHANSLNDKQNFLSSLVSALSENSDDPLGQEFLMEQVNKILIPKKIIPNVRLEVQSNQREYIPSTRSKKDYPASEFGETMNDILLRIKSELPDPSWAIELLVANKLINNKDLPIELVFKKVWVPFQMKGQSLSNIDWKKQVQSTSMVIVYRITGFDGEANEELVDQIVDEDQTACLQLSRVLFEVREGQTEENCGITSLTKIIKSIYQDPEQKSKLLSIITILNTTCQHSEGRKLVSKILKDRNNRTISQFVLLWHIPFNSLLIIFAKKLLKYGGLGIIMRVLMKYLPSMNESEPECLVNRIFELIHGLLDEVENEKLQVNLGGNLDIKSTEEECLANVQACIDKIHKIEEKSKVLTNKTKSLQLVADLGRILPIITYDFSKPSQFLVNTFQSAIQFEDQQMKQENLDLIQKYIEIADKIPEEFQSFREESVKQGILEKATKAFISVIPTFNDINQVKASGQKNCLKRCLQVFIGLSKGNHLVQKILNDQGILHSIYQLADPSVKIEEVGKSSEVLIEYIVNEKNNVDKQVQASIIKIKQEEMQRKKEKADQVKKNQLSMLTTNAQKILMSFNLSDIEEEHSIKCVVCQEGYTLRPSEIMGAYILSVNAVVPDDKKLLQDGLLADKPGYSSVTSFNCIHLKCHHEAVLADQNSKKPKTEWEGALIRNSEAKCNNWFPLKGPEIEKQHMDVGLKKYMKSIQGQAGQNLLWNLICDFRGLLFKFASQEDIAKETRTTFEHNLKIFPFFISAIGYVASQNEYKETLLNIQTQLKKMLAKEIKEENRKLEFLHTFLVLSLFVVTPEEWKSEIRKQFLKHILYLFVSSYFKANSDFDSRVCKYGQSSLILFALVNLIFTTIHTPALNGHQGALSLFHQKLDGYISFNYDTLIEKFQSLHGEYRDKITKFQKFSEFLDYCDATKDILESTDNINTVLSNYRE